MNFERCCMAFPFFVLGRIFVPCFVYFIFSNAALIDDKMCDLTCKTVLYSE